MPVTEMGDTIILPSVYLLCLILLIVSWWIFLFVLVYSVHETDMHEKCQKNYSRKKNIYQQWNISFADVISTFPSFQTYFEMFWFLVEILHFSKSQKKFGWTSKLNIRRSINEGKDQLMTNFFNYMHVEITPFPPKVTVYHL